MAAVVSWRLAAGSSHKRRPRNAPLQNIQPQKAHSRASSSRSASWPYTTWEVVGS